MNKLQEQFEKETGSRLDDLDYLRKNIKWLELKIEGERKRFKEMLGRFEGDIIIKEQKRILSIIDKICNEYMSTDKVINEKFAESQCYEIKEELKNKIKE